jgi:hypothetical protein
LGGEETAVATQAFPAIGIKIVDGMVSTIGESRLLGSLAGAHTEISDLISHRRVGGPGGATVSVAFGGGGRHEKVLDGDGVMSAALQEVAQFNAMAVSTSIHVAGYPRSSPPAGEMPAALFKARFECCTDCIDSGCDKMFGSPVYPAPSRAECDCRRHHHYHLVTLVVDPSLLSEEQSKLVRKLLSAGSAYWIVRSAAYARMASKGGFSWKSALSRGRGGSGSPDLSRCVQPTDLDMSSYELVRRTQKAISFILESGVYGRHLSDHSVNESALRRHEWEIAVALKDITGLSRELERSANSGPTGPMTVAVLDSQRQALMLAKTATESRINALERYASELKMADVAERDWQAAMNASSRNDQYLDLLARTAADELAVTELQGLTEQAAAAGELFREHLHQASLAAEALILPTIQLD